MVTWTGLIMGRVRGCRVIGMDSHLSDIPPPQNLLHAIYTYLTCQLGRSTNSEEVRVFTNSPKLRQVSSSLSHDPDWNTFYLLSISSPDQQVVLEGGEVYKVDEIELIFVPLSAILAALLFLDLVLGWCRFK